MDNQLVVRAQQGDGGAFTAIVDAIGGRLHAIAFSVLRDRELADDVTQETLLTAWRDLQKLRDPDRFEAWTCRILVRTCHAQNRKTDGWLPTTREHPGPEPAIPDETARVVARDRIERAFRQLNLDQRLVVVLSYYLDLPPAVVADHSTCRSGPCTRGCTGHFGSCTQPSTSMNEPNRSGPATPRQRPSRRPRDEPRDRRADRPTARRRYPRLARRLHRIAARRHRTASVGAFRRPESTLIHAPAPALVALALASLRHRRDA